MTIVKTGFRVGDNAEKSRVSLIGMDKKKKATEKKAEEKKVKKEIKKEDKKKVLDIDKRVDKTAVVKHGDRARTRSGL